MKTLLLAYIVAVCMQHASAVGPPYNYTVHRYWELSKAVDACEHKNCTIHIDKVQLKFPAEVTLRSGNITIIGIRQPNGEYPMLNGQDKGRLFTVSKLATASFERLTLKKGKAVDGGALKILGKVEYIRNCTFEGNQANDVSYCSLHPECTLPESLCFWKFHDFLRVSH